MVLTQFLGKVQIMSNGCKEFQNKVVQKIYCKFHIIEIVKSNKYRYKIQIFWILKICTDKCKIKKIRKLKVLKTIAI